MANVTLTPYYNIKTLATKDRIAIQRTNHIDIPFEFIITAEGAGDDTGTGTMSGTITLGANLGYEFYYCISNILFFTSDSGNGFYVYTRTDQWDNFYNANHTDEFMTLYDADQNNKGANQQDLVNNIIYLGRPRKADAAGGQITCSFVDHASTSLYNYLISGFALKNPLPLCSIQQHNPLT